MDAMYLLYVPIAALFVVFVIGGGLLLPLWEITEPLRDRRRSRGSHRPAAEVVEIGRPARAREDDKVAA